MGPFNIHSDPLPVQPELLEGLMIIINNLEPVSDFLIASL